MSTAACQTPSMTAAEAKVIAAASRVSHAVAPYHRARAQELLSLAFGVGLTMQESADLIAARLEEYDRVFVDALCSP